MHQLISISIISMLLFVGCAKTNADYNALRNNKHNTVKIFSTLTEKKLENEKELTIELGDTDKEIVTIDNQRVFASKLDISKTNKPFSVDIISASTAGFFAPKIFFLSDTNKIIKTTTARDLRFDRGFFKGTVFINKDYEKIASLVVTQDLNELHKKHKVSYVTSTPVVIPVGLHMMTYISSSGDQNKTIKNAYGGNIKLKLQVYNPKKVDNK